jgi:hypothetical protein
MNKNIEELKKIEDKIFKTDIKKLDEKELTYMMEKIVHCEILILEGFALILEGFEKRIKELEKHNLEYHGINETGGINNIKIILDDPKLKKKGGRK